jgi:pimeloyl-ACP methyl ester carboxylesterase
MTDRLDVPVAGGALATFRLGTASGDAPLVLAIHGITSTSRAWLATARALGARTPRQATPASGRSPALIAVDLRGRGRSNGLPGPFGVAVHVADMVAVLDHLGLERAVVVGHSLGAYIAAALATIHPERVSSVVLVDGGLRIPESEGVDPEAFLAAFLGPTITRLRMTFPDRETYRAWWARHPAFAGSDIAPEDLAAYADHDLVGEPPQMRSSVNPQVVRDDGVDLFDCGPAESLGLPATFLCAPRGMVNDPNPMQPVSDVNAWVAADPERRRGIQVPDVNHYTIAFGLRGASAVAAEIERAADTHAA